MAGTINLWLERASRFLAKTDLRSSHKFNWEPRIRSHAHDLKKVKNTEQHSLSSFRWTLVPQSDRPFNFILVTDPGPALPFPSPKRRKRRHALYYSVDGRKFYLTHDFQAHILFSAVFFLSMWLLNCCKQYMTKYVTDNHRLNSGGRPAGVLLQCAQIPLSASSWWLPRAVRLYLDIVIYNYLSVLIHACSSI